MKPTVYITHILLFFSLLANAHENTRLLKKEQVRTSADWLFYQANQPIELYNGEDGYFVLSNGLVSRTFSIEPNGATIGLEHLQTGESFLHPVRPEAEIRIDGTTFEVGGLTGQPIHNYLLPEWIESMKANPASFKLLDYKLENSKDCFSCKKKKAGMPKDMPWPAPGKELIFTYKLDNEALKILSERLLLDENLQILFGDSFAVSLSNEENVSSVRDKLNGTEYLMGNQSSPVLSIYLNGKIETHSSARLNGDFIVLKYAQNNAEARIAVAKKEEYLTFELAEISSVGKVELFIWGPYHTKIKGTVGESVGVVRNKEFAMGIQPQFDMV